jgi:hypothetical protein
MKREKGCTYFNIKKYFIDIDIDIDIDIFILYMGVIYYFLTDLFATIISIDSSFITTML